MDREPGLLKCRVQMVKRDPLRHGGGSFFEALERGAEIDRGPGRQVDAESADEFGEITRPADGHRDIGDAIFEHQVPADDPGDQLAEGGVGICVSTSRDRDHGRELGIAKRREPAGHGGQPERKDDRRPGPRPYEISGRGGADHGKDPGTDDRADPEQNKIPGPERFFQTFVRVVGFLEDGAEVFELEKFVPDILTLRISEHILSKKRLL